MASQALHRVVTIGGGIAGLFAARELRRGPISVTLFDQREHHTFQPLLYQCATGILSEGQITAPLRRLMRRRANTECQMAKVIDVDVAASKVICVRPLGEQIEVGAVLTWWVAFTQDLRRERAFTTREIGLAPTIYAALPPKDQQEPGRTDP